MHILVISIGPVQEFIASARKCRDLWFGSWLLSELSRHAAKGLVSASEGTEAEVLVFPGAPLSRDDASVGNKIVARVEGDVSKLAAAAEEAMKSSLRDLYGAAFQRVGRHARDRSKYFTPEMQETAKRQVEGLIEFLWAAAPQGEGDYEAARAEAERLLASVKASKAWRQPTWAKAGVVKSSLDGVRESVLHEALYDAPRIAVDPARHEAGKRQRRRFGVHGAERLCGVGLLKRFGNYEDPDLREDRKGPELAYRTFSTTHVASGPFRAGLDSIGAHGAFSQYKKALEELAKRYDIKPWDLDVVPASDPVTEFMDGSVFYEGRLSAEVEEMGGDRGAVEQARGALRDFRGAVRELGEPIPYYAIVLADGDNMGRAIDACSSHERHRQLSVDLEEFASGARGTIRASGGRLIYAGGDDVLGLVPLHRLLECVSALESDFRTKLSPYRYAPEPGGEAGSPTLSVGVAIVHALDPLQESLELARAAERLAKKVKGKNGLAILVKPRGGAEVEVSGAFERDSYVARLRELTRMHRKELLSAKTQYELMDVADRLARAKADPKLDAQKNKTLELVADVETRRLLSRKRAKGGGDVSEEILERLESYGALSKPGRLGRELYVASHLARAEEQARMSPARSEAAE